MRPEIGEAERENRDAGRTEQARPDIVLPLRAFHLQLSGLETDVD
jgi:hypothetical protein